MKIKRYYLYELFYSFMPIYAVSALLFQSNGISILQLSILLAINTVPCILLEIPSGILADRWSRKNLLVIASFLKALGFICWLVPNQFVMYAVGYICWGISSAFCSGSKEALLYDSLKCENKEDQFEQVYGTGNFIAKISGVFACAIGGYFSSIFGMTCPLIISIFSCVISGIFALSLKEVNLYRSQKSKKVGKAGLLCLDELRFFYRRRNVAIVMLLAVFILCSSGVLEEYDQLIITDLGLSLSAVGLWAAFSGVFEGIGNLLAHTIKRFFNEQLHIKRTIMIISFIGVSGAICLGITAIVQQLWALIIYAVYYFLMAVCGVLAEEYMQQKIEEEGRSTVHSIVSLLLNLFGMISFLIFGAIFEWKSLFFGLLITSVFMIIVILFFCCLHRYIEKRMSIQSEIM